MVFPRPTPPHIYSPRCGAAPVPAGSHGKCCRNFSPRDPDESARFALKRSRRTAASSCAASDSRRRAATWCLRRDSTDLGKLSTQTLLETLIVGPGTALRSHPRDLSWVGGLEVAGLAMHAIGGIDRQRFA